jgi:hypothetical protein
MVSEADVAEVIQSSSSLEEAARALVEAANAKGGKDNITVVLFRVEGDAADGEDPDTLAGQETVTGVSPEAIREAVTEADRREGDEGRSEAGTMVVGPEEAERARAERAKRVPAGEETFVLRGEPAAPARGAPVEPGEPGRVEPREPAPPVPAYRRPSRIRRVAGALVALVAVAAVGAGLYWGSRQVWFVGTDDRGQVTLYQGVPYDLPLGIELYSEEYVSSVPAVLLERRQQSRIRDHKWRSRDDAVDLVRDFERRHSRP